MISYMISYMTLIVKSFQAKDLPALDEDAANVFSKNLFKRSFITQTSTWTL